MSKRFTDTEIWEEDWFISLPKGYGSYWQYVKDKCDHAGIYRPNVAKFNKLFDYSVEPKKFLEVINTDKERVVVLPNGRWLIPDFIPFQYGSHLNPNNRVHASVLVVLESNGVNLTSIRGLREEGQGVKEKEKDRDKDNNNKNKKTAEPIEKDLYGEYVYLSNREVEVLISTYGPSKAKEFISRLNDYIGQNTDHARKYKSHYYTIKNWMRKDNVKKLEPAKREERKKDEPMVDPAVVHKFMQDFTKKVGSK